MGSSWHLVSFGPFTFRGSPRIPCTGSWELFAAALGSCNLLVPLIFPASFAMLYGLCHSQKHVGPEVLQMPLEQIAGPNLMSGGWADGVNTRPTRVSHAPHTHRTKATSCDTLSAAVL